LFELQDWSEAGATARRAETMLAALDGHDEQRLKAKELLAMLHQHDVDRKMAERLEQIRLAEADQPVSRLFGNYDPFRIEFDLNRTAQDYHEAFADYGIEVSTLSPEAASERIRNSDIRDELLVALDDWGAAQHSRYFGEEARKLLQITLLVDPDPWRSRLRTAATQVRVVWGFVNREKGARADVLQFARQSDVATLPPSTLILLSRALCEDYEYSTAQSVLHAGHLRHPDDLWINYELGKLHLRRMTPSQPQAAVAYFRAALASRPESSGVRVWLAEALIALQQLDEAVEILKWAVESNPQCGWGHQLLGQCHERREEWSEAIASYTKWSQLKPFSNPSVRSASIERARCFSKAQQWNEAISEWSKAAEVWPGAVSVRVNLAHAYRNLRRFDEAVEQCQKAIQLEATADNAHFEMGLSLSQKDEWDKALPAFTAAADINPTNFAYRYHVADAYRNLGQFENAVSQYIRAIDLDSTSAEAHADLAWTLSHMRAWNGAIAEYRIAIRLNPDIPRWHNALAWRLVMHRSSDSIDLRDALSSAERAVALNGESANYRNTLGVVLYRCGRWTEAIRALEQSEDLDPSPGQSASNAFFLAMSHAQVGESDTASGWYETGVNVMSEHASELAAHRGHQVELEAIRAEAAESLGLETGPREPIASTNSPIPQALKFSRAAEEKLARAYFDRGERLIDIGKGAEALEYYDAALAIVPESTAFRHARLYALAELSRWTELREGFELLATDRRDDLELLCEYAAALLATGDRDAYQRLCAGVLERDDIWINARRAFLAARICATGRDAATDASRRLELAAKADQLEARRPYTLHVLALAQYRAGLWSDALHSIDASFEAQATWSGHINNWLLLALIHTRLGHPDEARQWADKAADWRQKAYGEVPAGAFPAPGMHVHDRWGCLLLQREVDELLGAGNGDQQRSNTEAIPRSNSTAIPATDTTAPDN
jgi:tetratricopeptide (TPR) repeat protein